MKSSLPLKIALIFPSGHLFDTPCVPNLAKHLARHGALVDLYIAMNNKAPNGCLFDHRIRFFRFPFVQSKSKENIPLLFIGFSLWLVPEILRKNYDFVICCGIRALFMAGLIMAIIGKRFAYFSLELYSGMKFERGMGSLFKKIERFINQKANFSIIQDSKRAELLNMINLLNNQPIVLFPNAPFYTDKKENQIKLKRRYGLIKNSKIVLYSGSLTAPWSGVRKILKEVQTFPSIYTLFFQSRSFTQCEVFQEAETLIKNRNIIFSNKPLSAEEYDQLVYTSDIGLAWYESTEDNILYVGLSSGKISHFLRWGKPFIVNRLPVIDEIVTKYQCGVLVDKAEEIGAALETIASNYASYSEGARIAYKELFDMDRHTSTLITTIKSIIDN